MTKNPKTEKPQTPRELINWWLDHIHEDDKACRDEVLQSCANDADARKFYLEMAKNCLTEYEKTNNMN